ncbi:hypothetical protein HanHA300_Chr09g0320741 [Helianthus annuus]|nr:hypothetical protein HanHA300_Chr09g0320741 [Helianthus annuus]KAJ0707669.1 hypothetical protein HanLR1_Chr09g0321031 [Helianthus annuus]
MKLLDEDFVADKEDGALPTNDLGRDDSDGSLSEGDKEKPVKKEPKKEPTTSLRLFQVGKEPNGVKMMCRRRKSPRKKQRPECTEESQVLLCFSHNLKQICN